jgi:hypothetical protein
VLHDAVPQVVIGDTLRRWTPGGYEQPTARPIGAPARVITPPSLLAVLRAGWEPVVPVLHSSAHGPV